MNKFGIALLCCFLTAGRVFSQPSQAMELAEKFSADSLNGYVQNANLSPHWIDNGSKFYYSVVSEGRTVYYLVDPKKRKKVPYQLPEVKPKKQEKSASRSFTYGSSDYWKKFSTDSSFFVYGYRHDLYLQSAKDSVPIRMTQDGEPYYSFSNTNSPDTDDRKSSGIAFWIKNSHKLVAVREDKRRVGEMAIINSLAPRPVVSSYKFPVPGDKNVPQYELFLFDADKRTTTKLNIDRYPDQKIILQSQLVNGRVHLFAGQPGSHERYVYFLRKSRPADQLDLCRLDVTTGQIDELIHETNKPHFNEQLFNCRILNGGEDILWWSERTGYGKYYLYDRNGKEKAVLGQGNFVSGEIHSIDTAGRSLIMEVYGADPSIDPYYRMYARVNFDGTGFTILTPGNGYHDIAVSPDQKYLIDTYSRMDMPPVHELRNMSGKKIMDLETAEISGLVERGWKAPELLCVKAADDSTLLYGYLYKPFDFDSTKKYPVISNVYPGPQDDLLPRKFTLDDNYNQSLAQLGCIVVTVAYRGSSPYRGREFHCFGYGNLRDYPLADDKHVLEQLAAERSYIDLDRVGIYGHSGGGFMSATAILTHPDFYKVAVAASGNYDSNIYTQWWGETYHGIWEGKNGFETRIPTTSELASRLKGKLFLITGDVDKNVHPSQTFRLVDALIKNNKRFDMMVLPGKDHGLGDKYYINLIRYYFLENLIEK
mgnify:CR=1 FL=1